MAQTTLEAFLDTSAGQKINGIGIEKHQSAEHTYVSCTNDLLQKDWAPSSHNTLLMLA